MADGTRAHGVITSGGTILWSAHGYPNVNYDRMWMECEYDIGPKAGQVAYDVSLRFRLACNKVIHYDGTSAVVTVTCNNVTVATPSGSSITHAFKIYTNDPNGTKGEWSDWYSYTYPVDARKTEISFSVSGDMYNVKGSKTLEYGGPDALSYPGYSDATNRYHFRWVHCEGKVNVEGIQVGKPPTLNYIINKKPYGNVQSISSEMTQIVFSWDGSWGEPAADSEVHYRLNGGSTINAGHVDPVTINNLTPGTTYKLEVYVQNSIGSTDWKSITIRTRYEPPEISYTSHTVDLECFTIKWESTHPLKSLSYKITDVAASKDLCDWTDISITSGDTSGTFETCVDNVWMYPKSEYMITFKGVSTDDYDYLDSNQPTLTDTTLDRSHITNTTSCIFGLPIDITIVAESEKLNSLKIWTEGNNLTPTFTFDNIKKGIYTFTPTQDQLDQMYRSIPNTGNTVPIHFLLTTHGDHLDWEDTQFDTTLTLTGIAKTAHVGDENNKPRRCQVWIGDENNKPRRVVMWVGDSNKKPRRTI